MSNSKYLRPGFDFALAHVVEECGEVLAAAGKTQRWGRHSVNPELPPEQQESNEEWLMRELGDLQSAIFRLISVIAWDRRKDPTSIPETLTTVSDITAPTDEVQS